MYTMESPILIVSICMGKPIRVQRVNYIEKRIVSQYFEVVVVLLGIIIEIRLLYSKTCQSLVFKHGKIIVIFKMMGFATKIS